MVYRPYGSFFSRNKIIDQKWQALFSRKFVSAYYLKATNSNNYSIILCTMPSQQILVARFFIALMLFLHIFMVAIAEEEQIKLYFPLFALVGLFPCIIFYAARWFISAVLEDLKYYIFLCLAGIKERIKTYLLHIKIYMFRHRIITLILMLFFSITMSESALDYVLIILPQDFSIYECIFIYLLSLIFIHIKDGKKHITFLINYTTKFVEVIFNNLGTIICLMGAAYLGGGGYTADYFYIYAVIFSISLLIIVLLFYMLNKIEFNILASEIDKKKDVIKYISDRLMPLGRGYKNNKQSKSIIGRIYCCFQYCYITCSIRRIFFPILNSEISSRSPWFVQDNVSGLSDAIIQSASADDDGTSKIDPQLYRLICEFSPVICALFTLILTIIFLPYAKWIAGFMVLSWCFLICAYILVEGIINRKTRLYSDIRREVPPTLWKPLNIRLLESENEPPFGIGQYLKLRIQEGINLRNQNRNDRKGFQKLLNFAFGIIAIFLITLIGVIDNSYFLNDTFIYDSNIF